MDAEARGAARLMAAMNESVRAFQAYGYELFRTYAPHVTPRYGGHLPPAAHPYADAGVTLIVNAGLLHTDPMEARSAVSVSVRDGLFVVEGEAGVETEDSWRYLRELPEVGTRDLDECVALIHAYTARLCGYGTFLEDAGVPRPVRRGE